MFTRMRHVPAVGRRFAMNSDSFVLPIIAYMYVNAELTQRLVQLG